MAAAIEEPITKTIYDGGGVGWGGGGYFQSIAVYTFGRFKAEEPVYTMRVLEWILI